MGAKVHIREGNSPDY